MDHEALCLSLSPGGIAAARTLGCLLTRRPDAPRSCRQPNARRAQQACLLGHPGMHLGPSCSVLPELSLRPSRGLPAKPNAAETPRRPRTPASYPVAATASVSAAAGEGGRAEKYVTR